MGLQTALYQQHTLLVQSGCAPCMSDFQPSTKASRRHVTYLCTSPQFGPVKKIQYHKIQGSYCFSIHKCYIYIKSSATGLPL